MGNVLTLNGRKVNFDDVYKPLGVTVDFQNLIMARSETLQNMD